MTVGQVRLFVRESLELGWQWERIRLLGGEPTLHPHLREIAEVLMDYRDHYPKCFIQLLSNGHGKLDQHKAWLTRHGIDPHVEYKTPGIVPHWFNNTRRLLIDDDDSVGILPPCGIFGVRGCGIGLTRYGYYLDGAGGSAARVAGYDIGVQTLKEVTWEAMIEQSKILCRICGHWNPDDHLVTKKVSETGIVTGKFWAKAISNYKKKRPRMTVYGGGVDNA